MDPNIQIMNELAKTLKGGEQEEANKINNQIWQRSANMYIPTEVSDQVQDLPSGIFKLEWSPKMGFYLERTQDDFTFPYKVYGTENEFIDRVIKTYKNTSSNLGVLLNGVKGTGKTVTAEIICNKLKLPVIIITQNFAQQGGINSFINTVKQDVIIFIDEYEKIYKDYDYSILTVMDGVLNNGFRRAFMLTTNSTWINENMLQRPGRLRYLKEFDDLSLKVIEEIVDDMLIHKEFKNEVVDFLSTLEIITVDIVKAVIEEVNIHKETPKTFKDIFNIKASKDSFDIDVLQDDGTWISEYSDVKLNLKEIDQRYINYPLIMDGERLGIIQAIVSKNVFVLKLTDDEGEGRDSVTYKIKSRESKHKSFLPFTY